MDNVQDLTGQGIAFVEWSADPPKAVVGQHLALRVRFGVGREFFEDAMVQPFPRPLDLPVQLRLEGLGDLRGAVLEREEVEGGMSFVLAEEPARGRVLEGHRRGTDEYVALELEWVLTPNQEGTLRLPAPRLGFSSATQFRDDLVHGRVPLDRTDAIVLGVPLEIVVEALPEEGRPPGFFGAVGSFEVWARVNRRKLAEGEELVLDLELEGQGNPALGAWPSSVPGFVIRGRTLGEDGWRVALDLVPAGPHVDMVPPIALDYYDPTEGRFRRSESEPIPIDVLVPAVSVSPAPSRAPREEPDRSFRAWLALGAAVVGVCGVYLWRRRAR